MAKKASSAATAKRAAKPKAAPRKAVKAAGTPKSKRRGSSRVKDDSTVTDALFKLLESPLVAELLAVGATAAWAAISESRYSRKTGTDAKSGKVAKAAGKAAAAAIGRRLTTEFSEIRKASKKPAGTAKA